MGGEATRDQVWGYLANYRPDASAPAYPALDRLIDYALAYHRDVVAPTLQRRAPEGAEIDGLRRLDADLAALPAPATAEEIQNLVYAIGKPGGFERLRDWFQALSEPLPGSTPAPPQGHLPPPH